MSAAWRAAGGRSVGRPLVVFLVCFALFNSAMLLLQTYFSQQLVVHPTWRLLLEQVARERPSPCIVDPGVPDAGQRVVHDVCVGTDPTQTDVPAVMVGLPTGFHSEDALERRGSDGSYSVLVPPSADPSRHRIVYVDLSRFEADQNHSVLIAVACAAANVALAGFAVVWTARLLRRPVRRLALDMAALDPAQPQQRLGRDYAHSELRQIAAGVNGHLDRVARFVERERSLLDLASHEFRTPIAVIAGAMDVLEQQGLHPAGSRPAHRIRGALRQMTDTVTALLALSREPSPDEVAQATRVDLLLPGLVDDHGHLLRGRDARFVLGRVEPLTVAAPDVLVRILVGNLLRNAAEHTDSGTIEVTLSDARLSIADEGPGFDALALPALQDDTLVDTQSPLGGSGLGLLLVRRIGKRFGWHVGSERRDVRGTVVRIDFAP